MANPVIFHVDVNSAFLSWEAWERKAADPNAPDLREIPSAVGGDRQRRHGIILAKSTPAKAYHIRTGEPIVKALEKCPTLTIVPPNFSAYVKHSRELISLLETYAPSVEQYSIDEAFCDMTGTRALYGDPVAFAHKLKDEIRDTLGFTVNIGVSTNRLLAKMASDFEKPDRVHTLFPDEISEKMWPLPVEELLFVGKSTSRKLREMGITTIGQLARTDQKILVSHFKKHGEMIWKYANGIDVSDLMSKHAQPKGYGNSVTLSRDVTDSQEAKLTLLSLCEMVGARLRADKAKITVVCVQIRDCDFHQTSRQTQLFSPTNSTQKIYDTACTLFDELWDHSPIRLLGVTTSKVETPEDGFGEQLDLFDQEKAEKLRKLDCAIDAVRSKFGDDAIQRAVFMDAKTDRPFGKGGLNKAKFDDKRNQTYNPK